MKTIDLALVLAELGRHTGTGPGRRMLGLPGFDFEVATLRPGERWELHPRTAHVLLVLDGVGTLVVDDWRTSLGGGHLLALPAGAKIVAVADGAPALSFLVARSELPDAEPDSEGSD